MAIDIAQARVPGLARRLAALLYDLILLFGMLLLAATLVIVPASALSGTAVWLAGWHLVLFQLYLIAVGYGFFAYFWVHGGQTLGMRAWRLRLQQRGGGTIHWRQALLRFLSGGLWLIPMIAIHQIVKPGVGWSLGIGLAAWWLLLALRLPDRWSATELVVLPKAAHQRNRRNA